MSSIFIQKTFMFSWRGFFLTGAAGGRAVRCPFGVAAMLAGVDLLAVGVKDYFRNPYQELWST
ncbi:hypothetical protein C6P61_10405 [Malikia spinosa]|jgi:hypothetical protein|uniref:Uncharacterized protein n=1 Tax=Malikia spinosa TaxID=86180 RepID=A0A2S9KDL8_9BURK|nr:hypothetical protein C6P61_10405 [Malikia spinosa]